MKISEKLGGEISTQTTLFERMIQQENFLKF